MKKWLVLILALLLAGLAAAALADPVPIDEAHFPNETFRNYVMSYFDQDGDGILSDEEIAAVTELNINRNEELTDLTGIGVFTSLERLNCSYNMLDSLDLRNNTKLTTLDCSNNGLESITLGEKPDLVSMNCRYNSLTELDLSDSQLAAGLLEGFVSQSGDHVDGYANERKVFQMDAGVDLMLDKSTVKIDMDQKFPDPVFRKYIDEHIERTGDNALRQWEIDPVVSINLGQDDWYRSYYDTASLAGLEVFTELKGLTVDYTKITSLDVSGHTKLESLSCTGCAKLATLKLGSPSQLRSISFGSNKLKKLDLRNCSKIKSRIAGGIRMALIDDNKIRVYDDETWLILETDKDTDVILEAGETKVAVNAKNFPDAAFRSYVSDRIDLSGDGKLNRLEILAVRTIDTSEIQGMGKMASMTGIERFTELTELDCGGSSLTALDLSRNTKLTKLECGRNKLTQLNLGSNKALTYLECESNALTSLNISKATKLKKLWCGGNRFILLDVSKCSSLLSLVTKGTRHESAYDGVYYNDDGQDLYLSLDDFVTIKAGSKKIPPSGEPDITGEFTDDTGVYDVSADKTATFVKPVNAAATSLKIPATITVLGVKVKVTGIGPSACKNMKKLLKVNIGSNVKTIDKQAFSGCVKLETVTGGTGVTEIGDSAFTKCTSLTTATLESKVAKVGAKAYYKCSKMKTLTVKTKKLTADTIGADAFKNTGIKTVKCPKGKVKDYQEILVKKGVSKTAEFKK